MMLPRTFPGLIGVTTTALLTAMQSAGGETLAQSIGHSVVAGAFAMGGAWVLLKETRRRVDKIEDQALPDLHNRLDRQDDIMREVSENVSELVGESRARRTGHFRSRSSDSGEHNGR